MWSFQKQDFLGTGIYVPGISGTVVYCMLTLYHIRRHKMDTVLTGDRTLSYIINSLETNTQECAMRHAVYAP